MRHWHIGLSKARYIIAYTLKRREIVPTLDMALRAVSGSFRGHRVAGVQGQAQLLGQGQDLELVRGGGGGCVARRRRVVQIQTLPAPKVKT